MGHRKIDQKSNEITAIPELLAMLELEGCVVTIDAMGTQTEIAKKIVKKGAHWAIENSLHWVLDVAFRG